MQKYLNPYLLIGTLSLLAINPNNSMAENAQVNYSGTVTQPGCNIEGGNTININLGHKKSTELSGDGSESQVPFVLTGCPQKINIIFTGISDPDAPTRIKLANAGQPDAASGVAVAPWVWIQQSKYGGNVKDGWMSMPRFETGEMVNSGNLPRIEMYLRGVMVRTSANKPVRRGRVQATMDISFLYP